MKKAFLDQLLMGFLLLTGIVLFVATVNDEASIRNRIYDIRSIANTSSKAMAGYYSQQIDMCQAEIINQNILRSSPLGQYLLDNNLVSFTWLDSDGDGQPDQVRTDISTIDESTFWYRFFEKDSFTIGPFQELEPITMPQNVNINYGGTNAGFNNMIGTYQLDANNCITNTRLILADAQNTPVGQQLGNQITTPPTFIFIVPDGFTDFTNIGYTPNNNDQLNTSAHCFGASTQPSLTINGQTANNSRIYFQHNQLNTDQFAHIQVIPTSIWPLYNNFVNGTGQFAGNGTQTYNAFIAMATALNQDNDPTNDINFTTDPNNQFQYAMEDLDNGGDQDFNDIFLNTTRVAVPNILNQYTVNNDGSINLLNCNNNQNPIITTNCPITLFEDTSTSSITWQATDSDGNVVNTTASAVNGNATVNNVGTITYTPNSNFFGNDTITIQATDDQGAVGFGYCAVSVTEVNDPPTITGNPLTTINVNASYSFTPTASDPDSDVLTFSITNRPSWANFNTTTGVLSGSPTNADIAVYSNILISVSDGRGGSASLPSFNIEVTGGGAPQLDSPIPDQSVVEGNTYTYNASVHFSDPDNDPLIYSISGGPTINSSTGVITYVIPDGMAPIDVPITVTASDGISDVSDTYILTITANGNCNGPFNTDFTDTSHGWSGGTYDSYYNVYYVDGGYKTAYRTYDFGTGCRRKDVLVKISTDVSRNPNNNPWENSDKYRIYLNNYLQGTYIRNDDGEKTFIRKTDSIGRIQVKVRNQANYSSEKVYIDYITLEIQ